MIEQATDLSKNISERITEILEISEAIWSDRPHMAMVTTAQAILEAGLLKPTLSRNALEGNNLFGIKGKGSAGTGQYGTTEFINGREVTVRDGFALYKTLADAFQAHRELLSKYRYQDVLSSRSANQAAQELEDAGYATDPQYAEKLQRIMREYL